jgi:hypothetical protein
MKPKWYVSRSGNERGAPGMDTTVAGTVGPMSAENLLEMASLGWVASADLLLLEGTDVHITVEQFLAMARNGTLPGGAATAPAAPTGFQQMPPRDNSLPEWLADVRQYESMPKTRVPDALVWLEDIRQIEESLRRSPPLGTAGPPDAKLLSAPPPTPVPVAPVTPVKPPGSGPSDQRGYDPETGQILDPVAYARWQKTEAERREQSQYEQPPASVAEVYLLAQRAIQEWVDAAANKPLVTKGNLDTIRNCSSIQALMHGYEAYGQVMQEKLWKRLFFLVDNRKKYYQAIH